MKLASAAVLCVAVLCSAAMSSAALSSAALPSAAPPSAPRPSPPPQQAENVLLFTLDGLRWQEVFAGADEALVTEVAGGVEDLEATREEFWRPTPEERRRAVMPFLWDVIVPSGQIFGNVWRGSEMSVTNGRNFSYPCYHEMLGGYPDERIDSNDKLLNPNPNVLEWIAAQPGFEGRVAAFTAWDVFPYILDEPRAGKTTLIFAVDHGRGDPPDEWRSHGADYSGSEKIWLAAMGPGTEALGERTEVAELTESQVAATIAALLGLDYGTAVPQAAPPIEGLLR